MKKQRISMEQYHYIGKYNPVAKKLRPLCVYYLERKKDTIDKDHFVRYIELPLYYWLPTLPIFFLIQLCCCVWDGGLKEFNLSDLSRHIHHEAIPQWEKAYERCEEIYKEKIKQGVDKQPHLCYNRIKERS